LTGRSMLPMSSSMVCRLWSMARQALLSSNGVSCPIHSLIRAKSMIFISCASRPLSQTGNRHHYAERNIDSDTATDVIFGGSWYKQLTNRLSAWSGCDHTLLAGTLRQVGTIPSPTITSQLIAIIKVAR
jgi:hypothetical protein